MAAVALGKSLRPREFASLYGVSTDTLRHYERIGVLARPPRTASGYRLYPPDTVTRVRLIRHALGIGFTLAELSRLRWVRDRGGAPCREVRALATGTLEQQIADLGLLREPLRRMSSDIGYKFEKTDGGGGVRISTDNAEALPAIHEFLKFQITDHQTGDPLKVTEAK